MRVRRPVIAAAAAVVLGTTGAPLALAADIAVALNGGLLDGMLTISRRGARPRAR
jgi:hypothetical protein